MKKPKSHKNGPIIIRVDPNLDKDMDKYLERSPFKEKLAKANETLKIAGLPKFNR